jgi:hypothetical protein
MPASTEMVRPFPRDLVTRPKRARFPVQIAVHEPMETAQKVPVQLGEVAQLFLTTGSSTSSWL